ncbi:MAG: hypothetical protein NW215_02065 [Hyphomicrobiales bacterium]|nr:hypothetical protein [Hyphomicrobiales bacterium]
MIQYVMLVALGFFLACFLMVLVAPSFWSRAVRLTRRRIESTMPLTLSEIEADKDQLRAAFAVKIRRLESALGKAREKSAHQLVELSRQQMAATALRDEIAALERSLDERRNAASVFEVTIKKRFPELEGALAAAQAALAQKSYEADDLIAKLKRREEALAVAQRSAALQQGEIARLREAMEKSGAEKSSRFKKRPSQWTLDEYRAEYDRMNVELSKLREQLSNAYDRETQYNGFLKSELQQLAEQIMTVTAPQRAAEPVAAARAESEPAPMREIVRPQPRRPVANRALARPEPWMSDVKPGNGRRPTIEREEAPAPPSLKPLKPEEFADKSLEEVLEAALPLSADVVKVVDVTGQPDPEPEPAAGVRPRPSLLAAVSPPAAAANVGAIADAPHAPAKAASQESATQAAPVAPSSAAEIAPSRSPNAAPSEPAPPEPSPVQPPEAPRAPTAAVQPEAAPADAAPVEAAIPPASESAPPSPKPDVDAARPSARSDLAAEQDPEPGRDRDAADNGADDDAEMAPKRSLLDRLRGLDTRPT